MDCVSQSGTGFHPLVCTTHYWWNGQTSARGPPAMPEMVDRNTQYLYFSDLKIFKKYIKHQQFVKLNEVTKQMLKKKKNNRSGAILSVHNELFC